MGVRDVDVTEWAWAVAKWLGLGVVGLWVLLLLIPYLLVVYARSISWGWHRGQHQYFKVAAAATGDRHGDQTEA